MSSKTMFFNENTFCSRAEERLSCREDLIYNVTEDLLVILEDKNITKKELSRLLGKSGAYITQLLNGTRNMTLGTLSDICFALEITPNIKLPVINESKIESDVSISWIRYKESMTKHNPTEKSEGKVLKFEEKTYWSNNKDKVA